MGEKQNKRQDKMNINNRPKKESLGRKGVGTAFPRVPTEKALLLSLGNS